MSKIAIVGELVTNEGDFEKYFEAMKVHAAASRLEPGCERFDLVVPLKGENRLFIYEIYADRASFDAHASTDRIKQHGADTKGFLQERNIHLCEIKDSGDS
ncbi:MAG: antibiotic biosynthesis monooxygenase [bacterium]